MALAECSAHWQVLTPVPRVPKATPAFGGHARYCIKAVAMLQAERPGSSLNLGLSTCLQQQVPAGPSI